MKLSKINEYAQTAAALLAIAGIVFVGIQVQQPNRFAAPDLIADFYAEQIDLYNMAIDSDIYDTVTKSLPSAVELSMEEFLELDTHYDTQLLLIDKIMRSGSRL